MSDIRVLAKCFACHAEMELPVEELMDRLDSSWSEAVRSGKTTLVLECQECIDRKN